MIDILVIYLFLFVSIILAFFAMGYLNKIHSLAKKDPEKTINYSRNLVTGIVSGLVVLILDRIITPIFEADFSFITN